MRLAHIRIRNILGIDDLEFDAGTFTRIDGKNGTGKTSVLAAVRSLGKSGGSDATLLRQGATDGEIVWVFEDGAQVTKKVTGTGSTISFRDEEGNRRGSPQTEIKGLLDMFSMNPVEFLMAPAKKRVDVMLESMPMSADKARIREIVGDDAIPIVGDHALQQIDNARTLVYDDRTGTNRAAREKEATISQLSATLPPLPADVAESGDDQALIARLADLDAARDSRIAEIDTKLDGYRADHDAAVGKLRDDVTRIQGEIAEEIASFASTKEKAASAKSGALVTHQSDREPVAAALAAIHADRDAAIRARTTRETIAKLETEAEDLRSDAERQTAAIDNLDTYKSELLAALPIEGLEVRNGEIYRHGIPFDTLNKAQQVEIAVEIAKLRAGDLKVVCVDDLEMLDPEHFQEFQAQALTSGLQFIVTRVSGEDFSISTTN